MTDRIRLLYIGPNKNRLRSVAGARFSEVICASSVDEGVELVRSQNRQITAALFDATIDSDELEELVAYLKRSFPEIVMALAGEISEEESKRLSLLGVSLEVDEIPSEAQVTILYRLASHLTTRKAGRLDWSLKVEGGDWVEITVPSKEEYVSRIQDLVDMLEKTKLDQDTRDELMLAIDELVRNAMEWGNQYDENRRVLVSYYCDSDRIIVRVEDEGEGFDTSRFSDPTVDLKAHTEAREEAGKRAGGFGIHLIRNMMDEVLYNEKGNVVVLTKFLNSEEE